MEATDCDVSHDDVLRLIQVQLRTLGSLPHPLDYYVNHLLLIRTQLSWASPSTIVYGSSRLNSKNQINRKP